MVNMDFKELNMEDIKNKDIRLFVTEERKVKISKDKQYALISGSHRFVRNVAGYSQLLTEKGRIDLRPE